MEEACAERAFWLWLADSLGPASASVRKILDDVPDPYALPQLCRSADLRGFLTAAQLDWMRRTRPEDYVARLDECRMKSVGVVTWNDPAYPEALRHIFSPPLALYYRGDVTLLNRSLLFAVIGTRRPSAYGVEATRRIAGELAREGVVLVSGLASGLDSESHRAALRAGTPTVACLAFGHMKCYPAENLSLKESIEQTGLTISEYPPDMPAQRQSFLQRNRLIAGLSRGVCVAEARLRSGTLNTARAALEAGRDVFSVPGSIFSDMCDGTNQLLVEGATCARCGQDILCHYSPWRERPDVPAQKRASGAPETRKSASHALPPLSDDAKAVLGAMNNATPTSLDAACRKTGLAVNRVMGAISELEIADLIVRHGGRQYLVKGSSD